MKKTLTLLFAIAIIGILGVIDKTKSTPPHLVSSSKTSAATSMPINNSGSTTSSGSMMNAYKDGTFTGSSEFTPYGTIQISVVISGGKINDVNFLQMPSDQQGSQARSDYSKPLLKQETLSRQSANIDFVSGATSTSEGYQQSLQAALNQARSA